MAVKQIKYDTMIEILKTALRNNNIISLCVGKVDWDKRIIGYIKSINKHRVTINVVDVFGSVVKNKNIAINDIAVVEINDSYNKHLEKLKEQGKIIKKTQPLYYHNKGNGFKEKLERLRLKKSVCTIFFGTEYMTGVIKKINENVLFVSSVGYRGTKEGESCCKVESITKIRYEGPLEEKISYLQKQ